MTSTSDSDSGPRASGAARAKGIRAVLSSGEIHIRTPYGHRLVPRVRALPGSRWDRGLRVWRLSDTPSNREVVRLRLCIELEEAPPPQAEETAPPETVPHTGTTLITSVQLLRRFQEEMRLRGYARPTQKAYLVTPDAFSKRLGPWTAT